MLTTKKYNLRYHFTERIFWFFCLVLALYGSYNLIHDELSQLRDGAVNIIIRVLRPLDKSIFPSIGICEMGNTKETYEKLEEIVNELSQIRAKFYFVLSTFLL